MKKKSVCVMLSVVCVLIIIAIVVCLLLKQNRHSFHDDGIRPAVVQYVEENADQFEESYLVENKAGVAVNVTKAYPYDIPEWYLLTETGQRKIKTQQIFTMDPAIDTWIFTEENEKYQYSCFEFHEIDNKEMVFIRVVPNFIQFEPFSQSIHYQDVPEDTLYTIPLYFADARCMWGNPSWVFVIPLEQIDETYCLNYAGFSLTGADILSEHRVRFYVLPKEKR